MYKVYVKTDISGCVTEINSDAFLADTGGWTLIDEGDGDKYHHAQGNYLEKSIMTEEGVYQYKHDPAKPMGQQAVERTAEEIAADIALIPPPPPSPLDALKAEVAELENRNEMYADLIQELAMIVYA